MSLRGLRALSLAMGLLPPGMGQYAIARRLIRPPSTVPPAVVTQRLVGGAVVELDLRDRIQAEAFLVRRYAGDVVQELTKRLAPGQVFFDVGANVGLVTFSVGARVPNLSIHAFEPHPLNVSGWRRNRELNQRVRARIEAVAVGHERGSTQLHVADDSGAHYIPTAAEAGGITVPMTTLDEYADARGLKTIHALKLDVEGHEPFVLAGAEGLLRARRIKCIVCELNDSHLKRNGTSRDQVIATLREYGFAGEPLQSFGVRARLFPRRSADAPDYDDYVFASGPG